jgi:hypothetical protein
MRDLFVTGVQFGENGIQVSYFESRLRNETGGVESALTIYDPKDTDVIRDIQDALVALVDEFLTDIRNPPEELPTDPRQRLRDRVGHREEVDGSQETPPEMS